MPASARNTLLLLSHATSKGIMSASNALPPLLSDVVLEGRCDDPAAVEMTPPETKRTVYEFVSAM